MNGQRDKDLFGALTYPTHYARGNRPALRAYHHEEHVDLHILPSGLCIDVTKKAGGKA